MREFGESAKHLESAIQNRRQQVDHAIGLLLELIERKPADKRNRVRLLSLLYENGRTQEFVDQAEEFDKLRGPEDDDTWQRVRAMGGGLVPGNALFEGGTGDRASAGNGSPGSERRGGEDRRTHDRRMDSSAWFGEERRKWARRDKTRRKSDQIKRRGK